jgi:SAM-dependent methyltransferase
MTGAAPAPKFGLYAERYARFRPTYPSALYELIESRLSGPRTHAVDLGAGTGQVALDLLARFTRVSAVEPDTAMAAQIPDGTGLDVIEARAEEADFPTGGVDLVTAGTAFHWMDPAVVCGRAVRWLRPGGLFTAFAYDRFHTPDAPDAQALITAEAALWNVYKHAALVDLRAYDARLKATGVFAQVEPIALTPDWHATPEALAGFFMTWSFAVAHAKTTGDEVGYAVDFARRLAEAAGGRALRVRHVIVGATGRV